MFKDSDKQQAGEASGTGRADNGDAQEAWRESVSCAIRSVRSINDIAAVLDRISDETGRIRGSGRPSLKDRQQAVLFLACISLVMNDLARIETQERGASRESAGLFAELEGRVRGIRDELDRL